MAGDRGYQTLINETLKTSLHQADIETKIRKLIREELKGRKAAWRQVYRNSYQAPRPAPRWLM
jgi:hypothetical protein